MKIKLRRRMSHMKRLCLKYYSLFPLISDGKQNLEKNEFII